MGEIKSRNITFSELVTKHYFDNDKWKMIHQRDNEPYFFHMMLQDNNENNNYQVFENLTFYNNNSNQELHVISVRGTMSMSDVLQDLSLWCEVTILETISYLYPILNVIPISFARDIVYYSSKIEGIINNNLRARFDEPIYQYINENIYDNYNNKSNITLVITGHSLGGGISQIVGARLRSDGKENIRTFGLSAPGTLYSSKKFGYDIQSLDQTFTVLLPRYDIVGMVDQHGGFVQNMDCDQGSFLYCHKSATSLCSLINHCDVNTATNPEMIKKFCTDDNIQTFEQVVTVSN